MIMMPIVSEVLFCSNRDLQKKKREKNDKKNRGNKLAR